MLNTTAKDDRERDSLLVNAKTAAALLSISERTLWALTKSGQVSCVRIGRAVRYDRNDLLKLIESKKNTTGGKPPSITTGCIRISK